MASQTFKLWKSGLPGDNTGHWAGMPIFMGKMEGETFNEAVANYVNELPESSQPLYTLISGHWYFCESMRICENYDDARSTPPLGAIRRITVWKEGYDASGNHCSAQHLFDTNGISLNEVVKKFVEGITDDSKKDWRFDKENDVWRNWGCRIFDNEVDARKLYG